MPLTPLPHSAILRLPLPLLVCMLLTSSLAAATYYVSPTGLDTNNGAIDKPWLTPDKAVATAVAGDVVLFRGGTYPITKRIEPKKSGTAEKWITFAGYPGEKPLIDGTGYIPSNGQHDNGLFNIVGPGYLRFINMHVTMSHGMGFTVRGPSHHVELIECSSHETFAPGIGLWNCQYVKVMYCEITGATTNRMRLYGDFNQEAPHEAISSGGAKYFEIAYNHVHDCDKEGIDIKEVSAHGTVHHNYVHDMPRQGLYTDAWFGVLEDVEFRDNVVHNCEWGIGVSSEGSSASLRNVRIRNNLFYNNRGSGIFFSLWGGDGPRSQIVIANNTFYKNGSPTHWSGPTGSIDLRSVNVQDITVVNNLCVGGGAYEIATFDNPATNGLDQLTAKNVVIKYNLTETFKDDTNRTFLYGRNYALLGDNPITGTAGLTNPTRGSFYLTEPSRARIAGSPDPAYLINGQPADLGAFAFGLNNIPDAPSVLEPAYGSIWRIVQSTVPGRTYLRQQSSDLGTWTDAPAPEPANYLPDLFYFDTAGGEPIFFRYKITDLAQ
ncbi:MAG: right-handed parallel beta-helix repeat-containing protein [Verrucomicrobiota bacterium]|nr:right-handed parallel beta-helix repeat-containing protein [Verrucomicrobiota bacterium]